MKTINQLLLLVLILFTACLKSNDPQPNTEEAKEITIFFVNDVHGQIDNFAKIKQIIDQEREEQSVIVVSSGDMFSGNPVVDNAMEKGAPMIDMMNHVGFDVAEVGNHEFDYGTDVLKDRFDQSNFEWICANVDKGSTNLPQLPAFTSVEVDGLKITFLGLVETNGKDDGTIPSAHPWKMDGLVFTRPENVIENYASLKNDESSDLLIALSHLGYGGNNEILGDVQLAQNAPWLDMIIGGHSHQQINTLENGIPVFQAGSYLNFLGKIVLSIKDRQIQEYSFQQISLNSYSHYDAALKTVIDEYNNLPYLNDVIGSAASYMDQGEVGSFYCDALLTVMDVDLAFQNTGGVRSSLNAGDITKREIFEISPFNNGTVIYEMTAAEIKAFLRGSGAGFYYSGIHIDQDGQDVLLLDNDNQGIPDEQVLRVGINDYIPAVHDSYFPENGNRQLHTAAETLISYLENYNSNIDYHGITRYYRYN